MIYERTTPVTGALSKMQLAKSCRLSPHFHRRLGRSMGIPGFSGFAAELTILLGLWKSFPWLVIAAAGGMV